MNTVNFKKEISSMPEDAVKKVTELLKNAGFGILTRIDFHLKIKEKLGEDIPPVIILGACNPRLAFDAYMHNSDTTSLIPCNVVIRDLGKNNVSVEIAKPTALMAALGDESLITLAKSADKTLEEEVLEKL